jgi:phosphate transport system substrate-binding protein
MKSKVLYQTVYILILLIAAGCANSQQSNNAAATLPPGVRAEAYIQNKGSDTMVNLALAWAEEYQLMHPEIRISVTGGGSGTGVASLLNGTVDIANASRDISEVELSEARSRGIDAEEHIIARDAIAVIVHPSNPVDRLTMEQVSAIFRGEYSNWQELGGVDRPIVKLSRETNSGTHVYFLEEVIRLGQPDNHEIFSADTLLLPSSEGIISEVSDNPNAIGYDGLGYVTDHVKVVAIGWEGEEKFVMPSVETVDSGDYPISRDLYMYTRKDPGTGVQEYIEWILSPEAQMIVNQLGFVPVISK